VAFKNGYAVPSHTQKAYSCLLMPRLGRGSAFALMGNLQEGIDEFTKAVQISPHTAEAYKVSGSQTQSAHRME
jgi:hypothetical protein